MSRLRLYTVYNHPADYPDGFVVREWLIGAGGMESARAWGAPTLEAARAVVPPEASVCVSRHPTDDPVIVESWF